MTIDGRRIEVEEGTSILRAAEAVGIKIPTLCEHPAVRASGSCRICLVEDEKGRMITSCDTVSRDGMSVVTGSERVHEARKAVLELILSAHPMHCEVCEKNNDCRLKKIAVEMGVTGREFPISQDYRPIIDANPFYIRDLSKCISCGLCVRACFEVQGAGTYEMRHTGAFSRPAVCGDLPVDDSACEFCGLCVSMCPVGALMEKPSLHLGYEDRVVETTCPYCGVGCTLALRIRDGRVIGAGAGVPGSVNGYSLCVKGRFGLDFVHHPDRLKKPLLRKNGELAEVSWEEALEAVSSRLATVVKDYGPDAVAFLSSAKATNEENYLLQKFARAVVGTNNVDHCARL